MIEVQDELLDPDSERSANPKLLELTKPIGSSPTKGYSQGWARQLHPGRLLSPSEAWSPLAPLRSTRMIAFTMVLALAVLTFVYLFLPVLQLAIMAVDESLDAHEAGLALVASRTCSPILSCHIGALIPDPLLPGNPVRETGPPANMAKLILLRQKVCLRYKGYHSRLTSGLDTKH